jgi:hypothetical protein
MDLCVDRRLVELRGQRYTGDVICQILQVGEHRLSRPVKIFQKTGTIPDPDSALLELCEGWRAHEANSGTLGMTVTTGNGDLYAMPSTQVIEELEGFNEMAQASKVQGA